MLIASATARFTSAKPARVKVKLNAKGKQLLKHAKKLKVTGKTSYTVRGRKAVTATKTFTLK